jgi:hypothetical protein
MPAQSGDLVVLGRETGQGFGSEVGQLADRLVSAGQSLSEGGDLGLQPVDLGVSGIGSLAGLADGGEPILELFAQVSVGPVAVEGGAVDSGFAGEGLDVAFAAGRDLAA